MARWVSAVESPLRMVVAGAELRVVPQHVPQPATCRTVSLCCVLRRLAASLEIRERKEVRSTWLRLRQNCARAHRTFLSMHHAGMSACANSKSHAVDSQHLFLHVKKVHFTESSLR